MVNPVEADIVRLTSNAAKIVAVPADQLTNL